MKTEIFFIAFGSALSILNVLPERDSFCQLYLFLPTKVTDKLLALRKSFYFGCLNPEIRGISLNFPIPNNSKSLSYTIKHRFLNG